MNFNTPKEVIEANMKGAETKVSLPIGRMILLGILAGAYIALGGATSSTAAHAIENVGLARLVSGCVFPLGLIIIVLIGGELFTGNCLTIMGCMDKRYSAGAVVKDLVIVWLSNFVGAFIIDVMVLFSGNLNYSGGLLGAYTIKVALSKCTLSPVTAIASGILCNILVCIAILTATAAKDIGGKIWAIFFPIMAFVVGGFEHCVANMFYIPMGLLAMTNSDYVNKAMDAYGLTADKLSGLSVSGMLSNLLFVTIGNVIGGMICVGIPGYLTQIKGQKKD